MNELTRTVYVEAAPMTVAPELVMEVEVANGVMFVSSPESVNEVLIAVWS